MQVLIPRQSLRSQLYGGASKGREKPALLESLLVVNQHGSPPQTRSVWLRVSFDLVLFVCLWFGVWGLVFGVWCLGFEIPGLGFRVRGSGFEVWGLGCGVSTSLGGTASAKASFADSCADEALALTHSLSLSLPLSLSFSPVLSPSLRRQGCVTVAHRWRIRLQLRLVRARLAASGLGALGALGAICHALRSLFFRDQRSRLPRHCLGSGHRPLRLQGGTEALSRNYGLVPMKDNPTGETQDICVFKLTIFLASGRAAFRTCWHNPGGAVERNRHM